MAALIAIEKVEPEADSEERRFRQETAGRVSRSRSLTVRAEHHDGPMSIVRSKFESLFVTLLITTRIMRCSSVARFRELASALKSSDRLGRVLVPDRRWSESAPSR
jgi:hypothetical protein